MKIFRILKEISNFFFIRRTIRKNKNTDSWKKHNLKVGYFGIMYTVVNLPPEVYESEEQYFQLYVIEQLKPINEYLASLNLQEVVTLRIDNKCDKDLGIFAFGIKYVPLFRDLSFGWIIKWMMIIILLCWAESKFDLLNYIKIGFTWVSNLLQP